MSRKQRRRSRGSAALTALFFGQAWLYQWLLGWHGWMAFAALGLAFTGTLVIGFAGGFLAVAIRDTWSRLIPPELAEKYLDLKRAGWRKARVHPWWACDEKQPHMHLVSQDGERVTVTWAGQVTLITDDRAIAAQHTMRET